MAPFERLADEDFCYLTTTGRVSGRPHTIEIWFGLRDGVLYLLSGGGDRADWVKNIRRSGAVRLKVGSRSLEARARVLRAGTDEDALARRILDEKYMGWREGRKLSSWARGALPVAIDLPRSRS
ncbi:MAG: nitroreductase family deazaflavin-dependent oxidoreductase [Candidatus Limnocylindria bacterium]